MILLYGYIFYYVAALLGISIGYHRYFTHKSFHTNLITEYIMLMLGTICGGRSVLTWAAVHRMHHANSDTEEDPHSPMFKGAWNVLASRWRVRSIPKKYIKDLLSNPRIVFFHRYGRYIHLTYAAILLFISIDVFVIFVVVPYVLAWIGFGALNYFAHKDGQPSNVPILNLIAPGEGWHKTHHEKPQATKLHNMDIAGVVIEYIRKI